MALEFVRNIHYFPVAIYNDNIVEVKTDSTATGEYAVIGIRVKIRVDGEIVMETFAPIFFKTAVFNMNKIYPSLYGKFNSPIQRTSSTGAKLINSNDSTLVFDELYEEVLANGETGDTDAWTRYTVKSTDSLKGVLWDDDKGTFLSYNFKPRYALKDSIITFSCINDFGKTSELRYTTDLVTDQPLINIPNYRYISTINLNASEFSGAKYIKLHSPDLYNSITYFFDKNNYSRTKTLYWLNQYGGWEQMDFVDYEKTTSTNKKNYDLYSGRGGLVKTKTISSNSEEEYKLYVRQLNDEYLEVLNSLITSSTVIDETGEEVIINDNNFTNDYNFEQSYISMKYAVKNKVIKY